MKSGSLFTKLAGRTAAAAGRPHYEELAANARRALRKGKSDTDIPRAPESDFLKG